MHAFKRRPLRMVTDPPGTFTVPQTGPADRAELRLAGIRSRRGPPAVMQELATMPRGSDQPNDLAALVTLAACTSMQQVDQAAATTSALVLDRAIPTCARLRDRLHQTVTTSTRSRSSHLLSHRPRSPGALQSRLSSRRSAAVPRPSHRSTFHSPRPNDSRVADARNTISNLSK